MLQDTKDVEKQAKLKSQLKRLISNRKASTPTVTAIPEPIPTIKSKPEAPQLNSFWWGPHINPDGKPGVARRRSKETKSKTTLKRTMSFGKAAEKLDKEKDDMGGREASGIHSKTSWQGGSRSVAKENGPVAVKRKSAVKKKQGLKIKTVNQLLD